MRFQYFALLDGRSDTDDAMTAKLQTLGLERHLSAGGLTLFVSKDTPVLIAPGGSIVIGDLYDLAGITVVDGASLPDIPEADAFRTRLLANYWGEYILMQPCPEARSTIILRDPSGGIPCAYCLRDNAAFATSDISIAAAAGLYDAHIDWDFIAHCLVYPHVKTPRTGLEHVVELLPGCSLHIEQRRSSTTLAWSPWDLVATPRRQADPLLAATAVRVAVDLVVKAMARTDRTLLVELSGGLDSSIVAACLKDSDARVACGTVITPLPGADERRYALQMSDQLGVQLRHEALPFEAASVSFALPRDALRPAVWALGSAVGGLMDTLADAYDVGSYYSGSGGDTVFSYLKSAAPAADAFKEGGFTNGIQAIGNLASLHDCTIAKAARLTARKTLGRPKAPCKPDASLLPGDATRVAPDYHPWFFAPAGAFPGDRERIFDLASNQLFRDGTPRSATRRVRMPLLSQPVMEACLAVPSWMWISGGQNRAVARRAFEDALPPDVLARRSKGTFMNYTSAVYRRSKEDIRRFLMEGALRSHGLLDDRALNELLDSTLPPRDRSFMRVFDLCMIENWVRSRS